jgi:hypothetical protein
MRIHITIADTNIFVEAVAIPQPLPRPTTAADAARILTDLFDGGPGGGAARHSHGNA